MLPPVLILDGILNSDGTIQLDCLPDMPPGRVRLTLRPLPVSATVAAILPDQPWPDESISAPFDLPHPGVVQRVDPQRLDELLPDPLTAD